MSFWSDDWIGASLVQRIRFHKKDSVQLKLVGVRRPDHVFYGIGPTSRESAQSRYGEDKLDFGVLFDFRMWRASKIDAGVGVRSASFRDGHYGHDPGILESVAANVFPLPDGFAQGYTAEYNDVLVALDSRRPYPAEGSGVRLEAQAEQGSDVGQAPGSGWIHTAAGASGFWDVNGNRRVVSLSVITMFSDPLGSRPVPFTELVTVGGDVPSPGAFPAPMPGFFPGRLVDRSAAVATLRYKWPIGPWIAGSLQGVVGNVFGEHLDGFDTRLLRFSGAFGPFSGGRWIDALQSDGRACGPSSRRVPKGAWANRSPRRTSSSPSSALWSSRLPSTSCILGWKRCPVPRPRACGTQESKRRSIKNPNSSTAHHDCGRRDQRAALLDDRPHRSLFGGRMIDPVHTGIAHGLTPGSVNRNVAPFPSSLSTPIRPPCASTMVLQM